MTDVVQPLEPKSLKEQFIEQFEQLILSGKFKCGQKLPPERELARMLAVSRPIVHEGLVELAAKGLVSIIPRRGTVVNDFRTDGSVELLHSLLQYGQGELQPDILDGMLDMRLLFETEIARKAAKNFSAEDMGRLEAAYAEEQRLYAADASRGIEIAEADFRFHHTLSMASGNMVYPLLMNSFRSVYLNILLRFYRHNIDFKPILENHHRILEALKRRDGDTAASEMGHLLRKSAEKLNQLLASERAGAESAGTEGAGLERLGASSETGNGADDAHS
ncbi:MAG: FadR/GntR family transcriptional regulator [bacterium]